MMVGVLPSLCDQEDISGMPSQPVLTDISASLEERHALEMVLC